MRQLFAVLFLSLALCSCATGFSDRQRTGQESGKSALGKPYFSSIGSVMGQALAPCAPYYPTLPNDAESFAVVADIDASGRPANVLAHPDNRFSKCFVDSLSSQQFPVPPYAPFPIAFDFNVRE